MKKYDEYKDSGVAWIGDVPKHWEVKQLKWLFYNLDNLREPISADKRERTNPQYEYYGASGVIDKIDYYNVDDRVLLIGEDGANLVFRNLPLIYKAEGKFWVNNHAHILKPMKNVDYGYMYYTLEAADYSTFITGSAQPKLSQSNLELQTLPVPPYYEQVFIAAYLDTHCAKIDNLISIQQKRIALLQELKQSVITHAVTKGLDPNVEMKQSGVEWIGDVPKHWDITKMNNNCSTITDYVASGSFADLRKNVLYLDEPDYAMLIRTADLSSNDRKLPPVYISKCSYEFLSNSNLFGGEVVLPNIGASIGNVYMVPKLYKHMSLAPNAIMVKSCGNDRFLYYYFKSKPGVDSLMLIGMAAAQDKFNKTELRSLKVLVPPLGEQAAIASYLDHKCATIDTSISNAQHQIELLQEYKQSLITEVVTGKRKVTDN